MFPRIVSLLYICEKAFGPLLHYFISTYIDLASAMLGDGQGGLAYYDSWGRKESDTTERLI